MTKKSEGWEGRLIEYIAGCASQPFRPGKMDCGLFFMGGMEAMTGEDISGPFRGKYRTIAAAMEIAQGLGFADHVEYTASFLDELSSPLLAQRGDCAVVEDENGNQALGIVQGEYIYLLGLTGLGLAPLTDAVRAFSI